MLPVVPITQPYWCSSVVEQRIPNPRVGGSIPSTSAKNINTGMRYQELTERRSGAMAHFKKMFPNTPDYVIQDFIYKHFKGQPDNVDPDTIEWVNELTWTKKQIVVTMDVFDDWTQTRLKQLIGDDVADMDARHQTQQTMVNNQGVSKEPIIVTLEDNEYVLQEGWHRTVAALKKYPEGYTQNAYIGE